MRKDYTSELYNTLKHNTALWKWLDKDEGSVIAEDGSWAIQYVDEYYNHMTDKIHDQLYNVMLKKYGLKYRHVFYQPRNYELKQLLKGVK